MSDTTIEVISEEEAGQAQAPALEILSGDELERAVTWLREEFDRSQTEFEARNRKLVKWRRLMEAVAEDAPRNSPFKNSSNVTVPLTQTLAQDMYALIKGMFDARDPLWTAVSDRTDAESVRRQKAVTKFMSMLARSKGDLDMEEVLKDLVMETVVVGGCFPKVIWSTHSWRVKSADGTGETEVMDHDGPQVVVTPVERCNYRRGVPDIARLPWIGVTTPLTEVELREMASKGVFDAVAVSSILDQRRTGATLTEAQGQEAEWFDEVETTGLYDVTEFSFYWDVDGSGVPVDLFFTLHVPTGTVLKQQYNTLGVRFIVNARYMHRAFGLTGRGVGQMTESMNGEATAIHNLTNDNMKVANTRMFVMRGSGPSGKEDIYPGKLWRLDSSDDLKSVPMGDVYPSSSAREALSWAIAQRPIGLSDNQMGFADQTLGSRDTARGSAMRLQRGDTILRTVVEGLKSTVSRIGMLVWMQCVANKERVMARERESKRLSDQELSDLEFELSVPLGKVPTRMGFSVQTTENEKTFEQLRQNMLMLAQLFAQYAQQTIPLAMQLFGPQGMAMKAESPDLWGYMSRILIGSGKLVEDIFRFFEVQDTKEYVPSMDQLSKMVQALGEVGQAFMGQAQAPAPQAPAAPPASAPPIQAMPQGLAGALPGGPA